ncbi:MAG TPA: hypothetical protein VNT99_15695 [Methylomirabilota bacterium]|nr:hypothetical protein [Methylomirabilota bacterium]
MEDRPLARSINDHRSCPGRGHPQLTFFEFSLRMYSDTACEDIERRLVPWFKERKAVSMTVRQSLLGLDWVQFRRWPNQGGTKSPQASVVEMLTVMRMIESVAKHVKGLLLYTSIGVT